MLSTRPYRAHASPEETWNLEDLFPSESAWESERQHIMTDLESVRAYAGRLHEGPRVVRECLDCHEQISTRSARIVTYANLRFAEDGGAAGNQALLARANALNASVAAAASFISPELLGLADDTLHTWLETSPDLQSYRRLLRDMVRRRPHVLSAEAETVVGALSDVLGAPSVIYAQGKSKDLRFNSVTDSRGREHAVSFAAYQHSLEMSPDTCLRRAAYRSFVDGLQRYQGVFAATFATEIRKHVVLARLRHYSSAIEMLLDSHQVPVSVFDRVLDVIDEHLAPTMRRLARVRRRQLGVEPLLFCDLKVPLAADAERAVTFEDTAAMSVAALRPLGDEYTAIIRDAFARRWIDRADNIGKMSGAFCRHAYGTHPYVLVTWFDTLRSAFVLIHELGHAAHSALAASRQRQVDHASPTIFSEAPSTLNELLLGEHLFAGAPDHNTRRWVLAEVLATFHHNFVTHLQEARLQRRIYELAEHGEPVTADTLNREMGTILSSFWGDTVEIDDGARLTWMRQPHYYSGLKPYTYAVGLATATAVAEQIRTEGAAAAHRWVSALRLGGSVEPAELHAAAGVDLTNPRPLLDAVAYVDRLVDELERTYQ